MLATRGFLDAGYLSEASALWDKQGQEYHDYCGCTATEIVGDLVPNAQEQAWIDAYEAAADSAAGNGLPSIPETVLPHMKEHGGFHDSPAPKTQTGGSGGGSSGASEPAFAMGEVPGWWTERERRKVLDGVVSVRPDGKAALRGGHRSGKGWPGKSEFPERWTDQDVDRAIIATWTDPDVSDLLGDRQVARKLVDGVVVEVTVYGETPDLKFRSAVPVCGDGVVYNERDGTTTERPLDLSELGERWGK